MDVSRRGFLTGSLAVAASAGSRASHADAGQRPAAGAGADATTKVVGLPASADLPYLSIAEAAPLL